MTKRKILIGAVTVLFVLLVSVALAAMLIRRLPPPVGSTGATEPAPETTTLPPPTENVFTPMDFGYEGDYLTCLTDESWLGVDVSSYQKDVDWEKVRQAGFEFAMLRVGFRGYGEAGNMLPDKYAKQNYENATAAGLKVGVYFFSQAISTEEALQEAEYVLELIEGWDLQMPVVYDWECLADDYRTVVVDSRLLTDCVKAFCDRIGQAGYTPMVYFNPSQSRTQMHLEELVDYKFWLAMYSEFMTYEYKVDMWQYTNQGSVPGIKGKADINLWFPYGAEADPAVTD